MLSSLPFIHNQHLHYLHSLLSFILKYFPLFLYTVLFFCALVILCPLYHHFLVYSSYCPYSAPNISLNIFLFPHFFLPHPLHLFLLHSPSDPISAFLSERLPYTSWAFSVPVSPLNLRLIRLTLLLSHPFQLGGRAATITQPAACATDSITALHVPRPTEGWAARYRSALILSPELRVYPPLMTCCWGPPGVDANTSRKKRCLEFKEVKKIQVEN